MDTHFTLVNVRGLQAVADTKVFNVRESLISTQRILCVSAQDCCFYL